MKKQIKNLIIITFILILIFPIQGIKVFAMGIGDSTYLEKGNLGFYTIQYCSKTSKNWYYITYSRTWYKDENGVRRIAYCVDPDLSGIGWIDGEVSGYNINISKVLEDQRLWRVYRNGYPYVTPKDLGVETEDDAYLATKQAAYWIIRGYKLEDINTYFRPGDTPINGQKLEDIQRRGKKVIEAIYRLVDLGYNGTQTSKYNNIVKINKRRVKIWYIRYVNIQMKLRLFFLISERKIMVKSILEFLLKDLLNMDLILLFLNSQAIK